MGLTSTLFTSLSGLDTSSQMLSVAGNNIANVNTTAFKKSTAAFQTQILKTLSSGSAPSASLGGTNPAQVGLGVQVGSIRRDFGSGALQPTGVATDMAMDGDGFFILDVGGATRFTRDGNFTLDKEFSLVSAGTGGVVQGYGVDLDFNVLPGVLDDIKIPIGVQTLAEATSEVKFAGNLNSGGDAATVGSLIDFETLFSDPGATTAATTATTLDTLVTAGSSPAPILVTGDVITITGATKGGATIPDATFEVGPLNTTASDDFGTTVQDLMDFLDDIIGIDNSISGGLTMAAGVITMEGNTGSANDILLQTSNFIVNRTTAPATPLTFTKTQSADGESSRTAFVAFDSLGGPLTIDLSIVLENKDGTGTQWRFYASSAEDTDLDTVLGTGTLSFDTNGQFIASTDTTISVDRVATGAETPQLISLDFIDPFGAVSALVDTASEVSAISQNGSQLGTLTDFTVSEDGIITGIFTNGLLRTIGQIPIGTFANNDGLLELGANLYQPGPNSGEPLVVTAASGSAGRVVGRSLELSNVDLAQEFVNLITASTGFSANSRVLTTSDRLLQELVASIR